MFYWLHGCGCCVLFAGHCADWLGLVRLTAHACEQAISSTIQVPMRSYIYCTMCHLSLLHSHPRTRTNPHPHTHMRARVTTPMHATTHTPTRIRTPTFAHTQHLCQLSSNTHYSNVFDKVITRCSVASSSQTRRRPSRHSARSPRRIATVCSCVR